MSNLFPQLKSNVMEQKSTSVLKSSLTYGLYMALISILVSLVIWAGSILESLGMFGSAAIGLFQIVLTFVLLLIFTKNYRNKELGGSITYGQAIKFAILVVIISTIISTIYTYVFHTLIDPGYMERIMTLMQEKTLNYMEKMGAPESTINDTMEKLQDIPTVFDTIKQSVMYGLIGGGIIALITSAIVKKNQPEEE